MRSSRRPLGCLPNGVFILLCLAPTLENRKGRRAPPPRDRRFCSENVPLALREQRKSLRYGRETRRAVLQVKIPEDSWPTLRHVARSTDPSPPFEAHAPLRRAGPTWWRRLAPLVPSTWSRHHRAPARSAARCSPPHAPNNRRPASANASSPASWPPCSG